MNLDLYRDSLYTPWGFRIQGGFDYGTTLSVQRVQPLGAAEGYLKPNDVIMAINGVDVRRMTHQEATEMIARSGSHLRIQIQRRDGPTSTISTVSSPPSSVSSFSLSPTEETPKFATNRGLAKMMTASLERKEVKRGAGRHSAELLFRHHPEPDREITSYLPKPGQAKRFNATKEDTMMRGAVTGTLLRSPSSSGRSTPTTLEFSKPNNPQSLMAIGVWTPPTHQPNARLVHLQYNSPFDVYSPHSVADMIQKTTGTKIQWQKKPPVRFLDDIRDSPTYRLVQEEESPEENPRPRCRSLEPIYAQSSTFKKISDRIAFEGPY